MTGTVRAQFRPGSLPRCTERSCPFRWTAPGAVDHPCADHAHDGRDLARAALELGIELAPGDRGAPDGDRGAQ